MTGRSSPAISAISRPQRPAQTTTWSAWIVPRVVTTPLMRPSSMTSDFAEVLAKAFSLPAATAWSTSLPATVCERGMTRPASGIPEAALDQVLLDQRELLLDLGRLHQPHAGAERLAGVDLAPDLVHADIVADARHLDAADPRVVSHLLEEIDRVERRPAGEEVVAGRVAEVRGMRRRADVGRNARLVDADDVVPAALDQVMGDGRADDATEPDDDHLRPFGKR